MVYEYEILIEEYQAKFVEQMSSLLGIEENMTFIDVQSFVGTLVANDLERYGQAIEKSRELFREFDNKLKKLRESGVPPQEPDDQ